MKRMIVRIGLIALVAVVGLGAWGCKKKEEAGDQPAAPAVKETPEAVKTQAQPATAPEAQTRAPVRVPKDSPGVSISSEEYWKIQLERLETTKQHYQELLAVYEKYKGNTPEAQQEIRELRKQNQEKMQEVFTSHGFSTGRDFFPRGPERRQVLQERQQFLKQNTEMWEKYQGLNKEIRDLRQKVREFQGGPGAMPGPGPRGRRGPGAPLEGEGGTPNPSPSE